MASQTSGGKPKSPYTPPARVSDAAPGSVADEPRALPLLVLLFIGSGAAALIYEVVWFQLLTLIVGSSSLALAVVLTTFMGGMCAGSLFFTRIIRRETHPLRAYAALEALIGLCGILVLFLLPVAGGLYAKIGSPGYGGLFVRAIFCTFFLLPPTFLMGATLPAIARWVEATPKGVAWLGFFYGGNIAGAVLGALLAGFYLLRVHDMAIATYAAVALNLAVAAGGMALAGRTRYTPQVASDITPITPAAARVVYIAIAISGATALAAQGVWTRLVTLMLGGTVYTFSLILAVFLLGLGAGSTAGAGLARSVRNPRLMLGWCQLALVAAIGWAAFSLMVWIPHWPINPQLAVSPFYTFQIDFVRTAFAIFPAALLWGASFPLALAAIAEPGQDPGRLVGTVYAANTVGAIVGALFGSVILIPWLGTQDAQRVLIGAAAVSALIILFPTLTRSPKGNAAARGGAVVGVGLALAAMFVSAVPQMNPLMIMYGRYMVTWLGQTGEVVYYGEGMNSSMAVSRFPNGFTNYHNAGKVQASSEPQDMRLQRMLGHITTLLPANPEDVLVIGCGAGVTAGAVSIDPRVKRLTIAEIEALVPEVVSKHFGEFNFQVVDNPKTHVQIDDARHFLLTTDQTFDAITSDPFDPWVKGAATLYTKEFWQLAKSKLKPGGVVTVFVQLYEAGMPAVKSEVATFLEVFPNGVVFGNTHQGRGYDVVLVGQNEPAAPIDIDAIQARLQSPEYAPVARSLSEIGMFSAVDLFSTFAVRGPDLKPWLADAEINRDRNLRLQFLAGLGMNVYEQARIYSEMLNYRKYPAELFAGQPATLMALQQGIFAPK